MPFRRSGDKTVNSVCFKDAPAKSLQFLRRKGPDCFSRTGFYTGMMPQSTSPPQSRTLKGSKGIKMIRYLLYSPDIAQVDLFQCRRAKSGNHKISWDRVIRTIVKDELRGRHSAVWMDRCEKSDRVQPDRGHHCGSKRNKRADSTSLLTDNRWFIYRNCRYWLEYARLVWPSPGA